MTPEQTTTISSIYKKVRVTRIIRETHAASSFELEPLDDWSPWYYPGQFITLVFTHAGVEERRSYSFSSTPVLNEPMRITVKRVENGAWSRHMLDHVQEGDVLTTSGIGGFFQLPEEIIQEGTGAIKHLFFLAAGSGITPVYSLIKTALHTTLLPVTLIYSNRTPEDTIFYKELQALQQQHPQRLHIEFLHSTIQNVYKSRLSNWLLLHLFTKLSHAPLAECLFYICGPFEYMRTVSITLLTEGAQVANIKKEDFSSFKPVTKPQPPDIAAHKVQLHIQQQIYDITVQYPHSITTAAKAQGIHLPYSCEAGRCGSCAATCVKGTVWMAYNEILVDEEIAKGRILTCQGYPVGGDAEIHF